MIKNKLSTFLFLMTICNFCWAQVPIESYGINSFGQVELEIQAQADKYYLLTAVHEPDLTYSSIVSMTMGVDGSLIISEPSAGYQQQNYTITEHSIANPDDSDGDGIDDIEEYNNMPTLAPINFANEVPFVDGSNSIDNHLTYSDLSVIEEEIFWAPFLNNQEFVKFAILNQNTDEPEVYFINSVTHNIHASFLGTINTAGSDITTGEIVYNPNNILPNGSIGSYSFNYSFGDAYPFEETQRTYELLVANMPFLQNNMLHFIGQGSEANHEQNYAADFVGSRIDVVLESDVFSEIDFIPFHQAEGYGFFKVMTLDENPGSRDVVLYDALPNSLPRVGGIITSVVQTPLSHVNLRAIQDDVPNAYIKDPLAIDSIANLVGNYVYYRVEDDNYFIREATLDEVNDWYENIRPTEPQVPVRDLSFTEILPLDEIGFEMSTAFGAKCSNVATMRTFGFPEGTIPNGFGIPFYFYDEFMKFNNFYERVEEMIADPIFITDLETRIDMLKDLRDDIKDAPMPQWMLDELQAMHDAFPEGTSVRCRSSTNNEDLPGFSGAGLYTSKTQHPDEGHIQKSIKQVYASMWNFRAYDERDFYRINQFVAAMGVLCHPNYQEEKSNGVGISIDPIYDTENTFYLNTQVGESLITNPDANAIPEEILLYQDAAEGFIVLRESNLVGLGDLVMDEIYIDQMRTYLQVIHDEFAILYDLENAPGFGMDIEYKVTAQDQLIIKQARPWVSFWSEINSNYDLGVVDIVDPQPASTLGNSELVTAKVANQGLEDMEDFDLTLLVDGQFVETINVTDTIHPFMDATYQFTVPQDFSTIGDYNITAIVTDTIDGYGNNDTLNYVLSKLHLLDGEISISQVNPLCGDEVAVKAVVTNLGETPINNFEIEAIVNGVTTETITTTMNIPYLADGSIQIMITDNLQLTNNEIILNLLKVNGEIDAVADNNTTTTYTDLESDFAPLTILINADNYPEETSWELVDELNNQLLGAGALTSNTEVFTEEVCVDYTSCLSLTVFDSFGDGICCAYGEGNFSVIDENGNTIFTNNGQFSFQAQEIFCLGDACGITASIVTTDALTNSSSDGSITITASSGFNPYQYSIDSGQTFSNNNTFTNLTPGEYMVVVQDNTANCTYEETVVIEAGLIDNVNDISLEGISVFPNPTSDNLTIEIDENSTLSGNINIEIYDYLGRIIHVDSISKGNNNAKTVISLSEFATGSYFVKCYNDQFENYFKVVKI